MGRDTFVVDEFPCGCKIMQSNEECCGMGPYDGCKTSADIKFCQIHSQMNPPEKEVEQKDGCDCKMVYAFNKASGSDIFPAYPELFKSKLCLCSEHQHKYDFVKNSVGDYDYKVETLCEVMFLDACYKAYYENVYANEYDKPPYNNNK